MSIHLQAGKFEETSGRYPAVRAKVIFNPEAGRVRQSPVQLSTILQALQRVNILPEVYIVHPGMRTRTVINNALKRGRELIIVCGGDGTIASVVRAVAGTHARVGIIPTGTRNNTALSMGIPLEIMDAVQTLQTGRKVVVDLGLARCSHKRLTFIEFASLGLVSALFEPADDLQKGKVLKLADLLQTLVNFPMTRFQIDADDSAQRVEADAYMVVAVNLPFVGANYRLDEDISYTDRRLDLFLFDDMNKLELLQMAVRAVNAPPEDDRIHHLRIRRATIRSQTPMPAMADGIDLGQGVLHLGIAPGGVRMIAGEAAPGLNGRKS